jgi:uncharacterized protein YndB with AHSA1/START domain
MIEMSVTDAAGHSFTLRRLYDAPPDAVFQAWTDPGWLGWFFNPTMPVEGPISVDLRVGGQWRQMMIVDETTRYVTGGVYREIVPGEKLVFSWGAVGGWPELELDRLEAAPLVTIRLVPRRGGTEMVFRVDLPPGFANSVPQMVEGWSQTIDRLVLPPAGRPASPAAMPGGRLSG